MKVLKLFTYVNTLGMKLVVYLSKEMRFVKRVQDKVSCEVDKQGRIRNQTKEIMLRDKVFRYTRLNTPDNQ